MSVISENYAEFLQRRVMCLKRYAGDCELEIMRLKEDRFNGWFAAGCLLVVLGIVLFQWLAGGVCVAQ